jgi:uncharacterized membrane protein
MSSIPPVTHHRKQFQVDRICYFSDAIIAIAITLLILEFKIPPLGKDKTWLEIRTAYGSRLFVPVVGMLLSFFSISNLWLRHHELFEHVIDYNKKLIKYNLRFLLWIVVLPLTTSFMLEEDNPWFLRYFFYFIDLGFCNLYFYLIYQIVYNKKNQLSSLVVDPASKQIEQKFFLVEIAFFGTALFSLYSKKHFYYPLYLLTLLPLSRFYRRIRTYYQKKEAPTLAE